MDGKIWKAITLVLERHWVDAKCTAKTQHRICDCVLYYTKENWETILFVTLYYITKIIRQKDHYFKRKYALVTSLLMAVKYVDDNDQIWLRDWSHILNLPLSLLVENERVLLTIMDYQVNVEPKHLKQLGSICESI